MGGALNGHTISYYQVTIIWTILCLLYRKTEQYFRTRSGSYITDRFEYENNVYIITVGIWFDSCGIGRTIILCAIDMQVVYVAYICI